MNLKSKQIAESLRNFAKLLDKEPEKEWGKSVTWRTTTMDGSLSYKISFISNMGICERCKNEFNLNIGTLICANCLASV